MSGWTVEVLEEAKPEVEQLSDDLRSAFDRLRRLIESQGLEKVREPHIRHPEAELWKMRLSGRDRIARALYVTVAGRRVVVVHAFIKKTRKTPRKALEMARKRAALLR